VQLADILVHGTVQRQDFVSLFAQLAESRQLGVSDEWHVPEFNVLFQYFVNSPRGSVAGRRRLRRAHGVVVNTYIRNHVDHWILL